MLAHIALKTEWSNITPPRNGLDKQKLFEFYESCGFELHGITKEEYGIFMLKIKE